MAFLCWLGSQGFAQDAARQPPRAIEKELPPYIKAVELISAGGDPRPFAEFLRTVRADFSSLGVNASLTDQCLSVFDFWMSRVGSERVTFDVLRKVICGMGEIWADAEKQPSTTGTEPARAAV